MLATGVFGYAALKWAIAASHGAKDWSNFLALAWKYAACAGCKAERSVTSAFATAGIVFGLYQRCGLGVDSGSPRSFCTLMTSREEFGDAASIFSM